jgi:tetratricopeptide (TPR) repeat protein
MTSKRTSIVIGVGAFFVGALLFTTYQRVSAPVDKLSSESVDGFASSTEASATSTGQNDTVFAGTTGITFDESPTVTPTIPVPDLTREPVVGPFTSPSAKDRAMPIIKQLQAQLKEKSTDFTGWLELGLQFSTVGDYEGARQAYEYAAALRPTSSVIFGNLGFIYGYHLKSPQKAEVAYKTAIANDPSQEYLQIQLFELYRDVFVDKAKARTFAESRIVASPEFAIDFKLLIAELDRK